MALAKIDQQLGESNIILNDSEINCHEGIAIAEKLKDRTDFFLDLSSNPLLDKGGIAIAKLKAKGLGLAKTYITDEVAKELFANSNISSLNVCGNNITDLAFKTFDASGSKLEALDLSHTAITDASIDILIKIPNLKLLIVNFTSVSDAAILKVLQMPSLCYLEIVGCKLTKETMKTIKSFNVDKVKITAKILEDESIVRPSSDIDFFAQPSKCSIS